MSRIKMVKQGRETVYSVAPPTVPRDMPLGALHGIRAVHALMCTEVDRIEHAMQEAGQTFMAGTNDDLLIDAYVQIYTNLISGLASVEEALEWLHRVR